MGALLAMEIFKILQEALREMTPDFYLWTDSSSVQRWCFNETLKLETFVANRVTKILECFSPKNLRWVDGKANSADQLSRGIKGDKLERWFHFLSGPSWLMLDEEFWPQGPSANEQEEMSIVTIGTIELKSINNKDASMTDNMLMQTLIAKTNSFDKIIHLTRVLRHFGEKALNKIALKKGEPMPYTPEQERERAVVSVIKYVQQKYFPREVSHFHFPSQGRIKSVLSSSRLYALSPFMGKDGLLRIGGRLGDRVDSPHPIIVPRDREVVYKILDKIHIDNGHAGAATIHHLSRKNYWILQGGAAARSVVSHCLPCKKRFKPAEFQQMAPHPRARCIPAYPFEATGVDLAGPYSLRSSRGRTTVKRWLAIFTCLRCRAVHVEIVDKLSKESFLCALVRFHSRRNAVKSLWSDNGTNFVGACRELHQCLQEWAANSVSYLQNRGLQWIFAPAKAPEWGGAYERMVGLFKKTFAGVVNGSQLTLESFHTFAVATEGVLNSRPLIPVPTDRRDPEALSPLFFLCPGVLASSSSDVLPPLPLNRLPLARSWHFLRGMLDSFWKRWTREYLTLLQNRRKWATIQRNLRIGDVVLLVDRQTPRDQWPLGLIVGTVKGEDHLVRRVLVRTAKSTALERHVAHVVLLEATPDEEESEGSLKALAAVGNTSKDVNDTNLPTSSSLDSTTEENDQIIFTKTNVQSTSCSPHNATNTSFVDTFSEALPSPALPAAVEPEEDRRTRIGVPLRSARLAHPHGT